MSYDLLEQLSENNTALRHARENENWQTYERLQKERLEIVRQYVNLSVENWQRVIANEDAKQ